MHRLFWLAVVSLLSFVLPASTTGGAKASNPANEVRAIIKGGADLATAKLALDAMVDPTLAPEPVFDEIDNMVAAARRMLATLPPDAAATDVERFRALRALLYEPGWWNGQRPFAYDLTDPTGRNPRAKLLRTYLATRRGNCVSMPILFAILGERLGLLTTLSTAPAHVFVKWTDRATGATWNFEATSNSFARDSYLRQQMPMTDAAVANGVYLKTLSRGEVLAVMASTVLEHLMASGRYEEAIALADVLLEAYPAFAVALVWKGSAHARLLDRYVIRRVGEKSEVPLHLVPRAEALSRANKEAFDRAEALGWREPES